MPLASVVPFIAIALGIVFTYILAPSLSRLFSATGLTRANFQLHVIPTAMGAVFIFVYLATALVLFPWFSDRLSAVFILGLVLFGCLGFIDDVLGSHGSRGFSGHLRALRQGRLTTGGIKALGGGFGALFLAILAFPGRPWWSLAIAALLMALAANTVNLFDLRPGRAGKLFVAWASPILAFAPGSGAACLLAPLAGSTLAYLPFDLGARTMLGDTGANLLGYALGMAMAVSLGVAAQGAAVVLLLLFHIIAERYSLTGIIEGNRILRCLDNLGRAGV